MASSNQRDPTRLIYIGGIFTEAIFNKVAASVRESTNVLVQREKSSVEELPSRILSCNGEAVILDTITIDCIEMSKADQWQATNWRRMLEEYLLGLKEAIIEMLEKQKRLTVRMLDFYLV